MSTPGAWHSGGLFIALLGATFVATAAGSEIDTAALRPVTERIGVGTIDWQKGEYHAVVTAPIPESHRGRPVNSAMGEELSRRVAKALADSVFLQLASGTRVDAAHRVRDFEADNARISLLGNIAGRKEVGAERIVESGEPAIRFTFHVPMRGVSGVIANLYDRVITAPPPSAAQAQAPANTATLYIDARGTGVQPALFPRILDTDGEAVYDAAVAGKDKSVRDGVVEYVTQGPGAGAHWHGGFRLVRAVTFESAGRFIRVAGDGEGNGRRRTKRGATPATGAAGLLKANIIIGKDDAKRLKDKGDGWLKNARVVVVTDSALGGTEGRLPRGGLRYAMSGL